MAKKWSEVAASENFKALSPEEQTAAQNQYFEQVVAPKVVEQGGNPADAYAQFTSAYPLAVQPQAEQPVRPAVQEADFQRTERERQEYENRERTGLEQWADIIPHNPIFDSGDSEAAFGRAFSEAGTLGLGDEAASAIEAGLKTLASNVFGDGSVEFGEQYRREQDVKQASKEKIQNLYPEAYTAGQIAGGISTGVMVPNAPGATLVQRAVQEALIGTAEGVAAGAGYSTGDLATLEGAKEVLTDAALGGTVGAVVGGGASVASDIAPQLLRNLPGAASLSRLNDKLRRAGEGDTAAAREARNTIREFARQQGLISEVGEDGVPEAIRRGATRLTEEGERAVQQFEDLGRLSADPQSGGVIADLDAFQDLTRTAQRVSPLRESGTNLDESVGSVEALTARSNEQVRQAAADIGPADRVPGTQQLDAEGRPIRGSGAESRQDVADELEAQLRADNKAALRQQFPDATDGELEEVLNEFPQDTLARQAVNQEQAARLDPRAETQRGAVTVDTGEVVQADTQTAKDVLGFQPERTIDGNLDIAGAEKRVIDDANEQAGPLYDKAYTRKFDINKRLGDLKDKPAFKSALSEGRKRAKNIEDNPSNMLVLDETKRALDDQIATASGSQRDALISIKNRITDEMKKRSPEYEQALRIGSDARKQVNQIRQGRKILNASDEELSGVIGQVEAKLTATDPVERAIQREELFGDFALGLRKEASDQVLKKVRGKDGKLLNETQVRNYEQGVGKTANGEFIEDVLGAEARIARTKKVAEGGNSQADRDLSVRVLQNLSGQADTAASVMNFVMHPNLVSFAFAARRIGADKAATASARTLFKEVQNEMYKVGVKKSDLINLLTGKTEKIPSQVIAEIGKVLARGGIIPTIGELEND